MADNQSSLQALTQIFGASWITQGVWVAAELGIADLLVNGPLTAKELAKQTQTDSGALYRVLRALASVGFFAQDPRGRFSLTPHANLLRSDVPNSQRSFAIMMGAEFHKAWGELLHTVQTGEGGFQKRFGMPFFQYMLENPIRHGIYDTAMGTFGQAEAEAMLAGNDFSVFQTVVDVGGGSGLLLAAILNRHPKVQGILFDLPAVVERARSVLAGSGLDGRCRFEGGDFFSSVPAGADAYIMQHVIHDWADREAITILRNCREAMNRDGRILLAELVIPPGNGPIFGKWLDLMMLLVGGRERTEEEYRQLFSAAGLKLNRVIPTASEVSIVEGVRAS
jgi:O-methyltransferase domain/Dimerisation domain